MNKKTVIKYALTILICGAVTAFYILSKDIGSQTLAEKYRILADGFTIPGLLAASFGLMMVIADTGTLDGVAFGVMQAIRMLTFQLATQKKGTRYGEFKEAREEVRRLRRERGGSFWFLVITGGTFIAVALIFVWLFSKT